MLTVCLAQFPVTLDITQNTDQILAFLDDCKPGEVLVLPEGAVSGYDPDMSFLEGLDQAEINAHLETIALKAVEREVHVFAGTMGKVEEGWANLGLYLTPGHDRITYQKCNLAWAERDAMVAGSELPIFELEGRGFEAAMLLCREIKFPAQWEALARKGAKVVFYLTNAVGGSDEYPVWRAHLISRAAELQRFVIGVNNAAPDQKCPTIAVAPNGDVLAEISGSEPQMVKVEIDESQVSDWYLSQARDDLS